MNILSITKEHIPARNVLVDEKGKPLPLHLQPTDQGPICFGGTIYIVTTDEVSMSIQYCKENEVWYEPTFGASSDNMIDVVIETTMYMKNYEATYRKDS